MRASKVTLWSLAGLMLASLVTGNPLSAEQDLTGRWIGPFPGDTGKCGKRSMQYSFHGNRFKVGVISQKCAGFWMIGTFGLDGNQMRFYFEQCGPSPRCPDSLSVTYRKIDESLLVAIHQDRCVPVTSVRDKEELVEAEAEAWIPKASSRYGITLAIKGGTLIASAGIDARNANEHFVLWPSAPFETAAAIGRHLKQQHGITDLGVILTDSHCTPLRRGTTGISNRLLRL